MKFSIPQLLLPFFDGILDGSITVKGRSVHNRQLSSPNEEYEALNVQGIDDPAFCTPRVEACWADPSCVEAYNATMTAPFDTTDSEPLLRCKDNDLCNKLLACTCLDEAYSCWYDEDCYALSLYMNSDNGNVADLLEQMNNNNAFNDATFCNIDRLDDRQCHIETSSCKGSDNCRIALNRFVTVSYYEEFDEELPSETEITAIKKGCFEDDDDCANLFMCAMNKAGEDEEGYNSTIGTASPCYNKFLDCSYEKGMTNNNKTLHICPYPDPDECSEDPLCVEYAECVVNELTLNAGDGDLTLNAGAHLLTIEGLTIFTLALLSMLY